jgi:hypothetical protein
VALRVKRGYRSVRKELSKNKNKKTRKLSFNDRVVEHIYKVRKVGDSDKNGDTRAGYLNNGMSRLDTKSRIAPLHSISSRDGIRVYAGKLCMES